MSNIVLTQREKRQPLVGIIVLILRKRLLPMLTTEHVTEWSMGESVHPIDSIIELILKKKQKLLGKSYYIILVD